MSEIIAGAKLPEMAAVAESTCLVSDTTGPLLYHHSAAAETVWTAIALHTTPGIPGRMGPEIATTHLGVLTDVVGFGLDDLNTDQVNEILAVHPRGDFKNEFLRTYFDGFNSRPETTNGTVNSAVVEHFTPGFRRTTAVERIIGSARPS